MNEHHDDGRMRTDEASMDDRHHDEVTTRTVGDTTVVGSFTDRDRAEAAIERLRDQGFDREQIGFAGRDEEGHRVLVEEHGNAAGQGAAGGLVTGAVAGGALAWLGLAALPAIGPFLAGGAIGTALLGAGTGALTGGVLGGLLGLGIPRHRAEYHEEQIRSGRTLVTIRTPESGIAERVLREAGADAVDVEQVEHMRRGERTHAEEPHPEEARTR